MAALMARVRNGRLILDEPTSLPEGTVVALAEVHDPFVAMSAEDREALEHSIDRGLVDARDGRVRTMNDLLASL